jgi:hypothetical protein
LRLMHLKSRGSRNEGGGGAEGGGGYFQLSPHNWSEKHEIQGEDKRPSTKTMIEKDQSINQSLNWAVSQFQKKLY